MTREVFKELFDNHFDAIRNYVYYRCGDKELATDIAQDVFMRLWEKQFEVDPKKVKGLLYKIANDMFISKKRREVLKKKHTASIPFNFNEQTPEKIMQFKELKENFEKALANLSEKARSVFLMSRFEEMKYHEIAERLDISVKAVEKRMKNALSYLKKELG